MPPLLALFQPQELLATGIDNCQAAVRGQGGGRSRAASCTAVQQQCHDGLLLDTTPRQVRLHSRAQVGVRHHGTADQHKVALDHVPLLHKAQGLALSLAAGRRQDVHHHAAAPCAGPALLAQVHRQLFGLRGGNQVHLRQELVEDQWRRKTREGSERLTSLRPARSSHPSVRSMTR